MTPFFRKAVLEDGPQFRRAPLMARCIDLYCNRISLKLVKA